jgi:hypothetical protein
VERADYLIYQVKYNEDKTHIERVKVYPNLGAKSGDSEEQTRTEVIKNIEKGISYMTAVRGKDGKLSQGQKVEIIVLPHKFIRSDRDATTKDNLASLPEF